MYEADLRSQHEAADRVASAADVFLSALDVYDDETLKLRRNLDEMRDAFGGEARVSEVESALQDEPLRLLGTWEAVMAATKWRLNTNFEDSVAAEDFPQEDLQELARERGPTRLIKEYFGKS